MDSSDAAPWISENFGNTYVVGTGDPTQPLDQFHIYNVSARPFDWVSRFNGVVHHATTNAGPFTLRSNPLLGDAPLVTGYKFMGDIAEVLLFNAVLSQEDRDWVVSYLGQKYALLHSVPEAPVVHAAAVSPTQISLWWTNSITNSSQSYIVERKTGAGGSFAQLAYLANSMSLIDTGLTAGTEYFYRVKARSVSADSPFSTEASATTLTNGVDLPFASLKMWLKADSGPGDGVLTFWPDQSGNAVHAYQGTAHLKPSITNWAANGHSAINFDASYRYLSLFSASWNTWTGADIFVVLRSRTNTVTRGLWTWRGSDVSYHPQGPGNIWETFGRTGSIMMGTPTDGVIKVHSYNVSASNNFWAGKINGYSFASTNLNTFEFHNFPAIGQSGGSGFDGHISEILLFNRVMSPEERYAIGCYLNNKYSMVSSPPPTPSGVLATGIDANQLTLSWVGVTSNTTTFRVERRFGTNGDYSFLVNRDADQLSYVDTAPSTNIYFYRVKAFNYAGETSYSAATAPPTIDLTSPTHGAQFSSGLTNTVLASAADADGSVSQVQFFRDTRDYGTVLTAPYSIARPHHLPGTNVFKAVATDNAGNTRVSQTPTVVVIQDSDGDGLTDAQEILLGTNLAVKDTDGDGVNDDLDAFPLDPARWVSPSVDPDDHTPPNIYLLEPAATPQ